MSEPNKIRKWVVEKFDGISPGLLGNDFEWKVNSFSHLLTNSFELHTPVNGGSHNNTLAKHS